MVTEMITLKLESKFLKEIDSVAKKNNYHNRTEFIRNALREKVDETKLKQAMQSIVHLRGASKKKTTEEEYERARTLAFHQGKKESGKDVFRRLGL